MLRFTSVIVFFAIASIGAAHAVPLTYIESATASGTLGLLKFGNALVTISGTADNRHIQSIGSNFFFINIPSAQVSVGEIGTFLFIDEVDFHSNTYIVRPI
jgi:hypothetical protein